LKQIKWFFDALNEIIELTIKYNYDWLFISFIVSSYLIHWRKEKLKLFFLYFLLFSKIPLQLRSLSLKIEMFPVLINKLTSLQQKFFHLYNLIIALQLIANSYRYLISKCIGFYGFNLNHWWTDETLLSEYRSLWSFSRFADLLRTYKVMKTAKLIIIYQREHRLTQSTQSDQ